MKYKILLLLVILTFCSDNINARRSGGSSRSSGRGSSGRSHTSHSSNSQSSSSQSSSSHTSSSHTSPSHASINPLFSNPPALSNHQTAGKTSSSSFIQGESLANRSPGSTSSGSSGYNSHISSPTYNQPKPSAPFDSTSNSNPPPYPVNSGADKPWSNPYLKPTNSDKPAWSNPNYAGTTNTQSNPIGRYPHTGGSASRHNTTPGRHAYNSSSAANNPAITNNRLQQSSLNKTSSGTLSSPYPGIYNPSAPYPTFGSSMPQPGANKTPYPMGTGSMPQPGHTGNIGFHSSVTNPSYGTMSQPSPQFGQHYNPSMSQQGYHPSMAQPAFNPHFSQSPGYGHPSYPSMGQPGGYNSQPMYQPPQPAAGPVIVMAGDSGSGGGRGLGQMIAEAAVFSTVNAGINRLINPHHDHYYSAPASSSAVPSSSNTHITYNNYINGQPVDPSQLNQPNVPGVPNNFNPAGFPSGVNNVNSLPTSGGFASTGLSSGMGNPGIGYSGSSSAGSAGTSGSTYTPTGNMASNVPAPGIVNKVGSTVNEAPVNPLNDSSLVIFGISNAEIWKLTEDLFDKQEYDANQFIHMNLQKKTNSTDDVAAEPLFSINKGAYELPSVKAVRDLFDAFESDSRVKENRTLERRKRENILLDTMMNTDVMDTALKWLSSKRFIDPDDFERKDTLNHIWFNLFDGSSCGFERVFVSETLHTPDSAVILGVNWISFAHLESEKRINYAGYVEKVDLGTTASLLKLNYKMNDLVVSNTTIFVGTLPELEMALYTICFYARPGIECPVSLGGIKFNVYTHMMPYFGKYLIAAAYPNI